MANRLFNQFRKSLVKGTVELFLRVDFGASGEPTISTDAKEKLGISSIARSAEGTFLITLQDKYLRLIDFSCTFDAGSAGPAAPEVSLSDVSVSSSTPTITMLTQAGGTDTDPDDGEVAYIKIGLSNSGAL